MENVINSPSLPKISVVMAAFNASRTVGGTIQNLLEQTYQNLEIIIVNDGSSDTTDKVVKSYQKVHTNIKLVSLDKNVGPFKARVIGVDNASGDYIHFIDADDYISIDFYRTTLAKAVEENSDIVIGSIALDFKHQGYIRDFPLINDLPFDSLSGPDIFKEFMDQGGLNFTYHMNSTKLYSMALWKKARPFYDDISKHLIMADDVALNVPLWYFANKLDRVPTATLFYVKDNNDSATSNYKISHKKMLKNIDDLYTVFNYFESFLASQEVSHTYSASFGSWKRSFVRVYQYNISNSTLSDKDKESLLQHLYGIAPFVESQHWLDTPFFHINTVWRDGLDDLKKKILHQDTKTVIFTPESLVNSIPLPDGKETSLARATGLELYSLAVYLKKKVLIHGSEKAVEKVDLGNKLKQAQELDFGIGSVEISLPKPVDIFIDRGLNLPLNYTFDPTVPGPMLTVTTLVANQYFDNPYTSFIDGSAYSGRGTLLGYYSIGLYRLASEKLSRDTQLSARELLQISDDTPRDNDPYESYMSKATNYGAELFVRTASSLIGSSPVNNLATHAVAAINHAVHTHTWSDRQLLRPLLYKYPRIIDTYETNQQASFSSVEHLHNALVNKSKLTKLAVYTLVNRNLIIAALKRRVNRATSNLPAVNKILKITYFRVKKIKQSMR